MNVLKEQTYRFDGEWVVVLHIDPSSMQYTSRRFSSQDRLAVIGDNREEVCAAVIGSAVVWHIKITQEFTQCGAFKIERTLRTALVVTGIASIISSPF